MGTCYFLQREDGKLFNLDKAYGLVHYLRGGRYGECGPLCDLGADVDALILVLQEHQPYPCGVDGIERRRFAERLIEFAGGAPVRLYSEHDLPCDIDYNDPATVIGDRWPDYQYKKET